MRKISMLFGFLIILCDSCLALTTVNSSGVDGKGFPVSLTKANETYQLSEDISCPTTCFSIKAGNITLDLNGRKATFGSVNSSTILNSGMEEWNSPNSLVDWTIVTGTISQKSAQVWGNFDAELSATAILKSKPTELKSGQTYLFYAMIKGSSSDSYKISLVNSNDDSILASSTISGSLLNRGFAMDSGDLTSTNNQFKPTTDVTAYLLLEMGGTSSKRLHIADIKPSRHFFVVASNYRNTSTYPDLADGLFGGSSTGFTLKNGTIEQGLAAGVKSVAINVPGTKSVSDLTIKMRGNNTSSLASLQNTFVLDRLVVDTGSILNFNRMHYLPSVSFVTGSSGLAEIKNSQFLNDPEIALSGSFSFGADSDTHQTLIYGNTIRQREQVTEGYAIALTGVINVEIYDNDINPFRGRGILLDSVANRSGYLDGTKNVTIRNNIIRNIHEFQTPEFGNTALEAAAIRVRDWGGVNPPEGHRNLKIYENLIDVFVDSVGTHRSYGINITSQSALTAVEIFNNRFTARLLSAQNSDWEAACISLQNADMSKGGSITIRNNECIGDVGVRLGGNDGTIVKNVHFSKNIFRTNRASILFHGYQGPFDNNLFYCNKLDNTSATGYPVIFADGTPQVSGIYFSHNQITTANPNGAEFLLNKDYKSSVSYCPNDAIDITGGGSISFTALPCHDGQAGCVLEAGPRTSPPTAPNPPLNLRVSTEGGS